MKWGIYATFFGLSMVKFLFTPMGGQVAQLTFMETYISCCLGAIFSASIFYFSASFFMKRAVRKNQEKMAKSIESGTPIEPKRKFTRMNKLIVRMKKSIGIIGISFWAPLFLSIPGGSIIAAKFYGKNPMTFPLIVIGIFFNGLIITSITYLF